MKIFHSNDCNTVNLFTTTTQRTNTNNNAEKSKLKKKKIVEPKRIYFKFHRNSFGKNMFHPKLWHNLSFWLKCLNKPALLFKTRILFKILKQTTNKQMRRTTVKMKTTKLRKTFKNENGNGNWSETFTIHTTQRNYFN